MHDNDGELIESYEREGEYAGQREMMQGAKSRLLYCPRCRETNCLVAQFDDGQITGYDCTSCGRTVEI